LVKALILINKAAKSNFIIIAKAINRHKIAIYRKAILDIIMLDSRDIYPIAHCGQPGHLLDLERIASLNTHYSPDIPKIISAYKVERELLDKAQAYIIKYNKLLIKAIDLLAATEINKLLEYIKPFADKNTLQNYLFI
ncbi:hypothetical protein DPV78_003451, partial [Talaromyces pinophilus]